MLPFLGQQLPSPRYGSILTHPKTAAWDGTGPSLSTKAYCPGTPGPHPAPESRAVLRDLPDPYLWAIPRKHSQFLFVPVTKLYSLPSLQNPLGISGEHTHFHVFSLRSYTIPFVFGSRIQAIEGVAADGHVGSHSIRLGRDTGTTGWVHHPGQHFPQLGHKKANDLPGLLPCSEMRSCVSLHHSEKPLQSAPADAC